jgi:hypothetical protein
MTIDKSSFLILVTTIAGSGAAGWFARDKLVLKSEIPQSLPPAPPSVSKEPPPAPKSATPPLEPAPVAASCDDASGDVPACPVFPDPSDEGGCGQMAAARCAQYREAFKPKVARAAVECLKKLRGGQICDPIALNKCGHEALMAACPPEPAAKPGAPPGELDQACEPILAACKASTPGPTLADCKQTLSGMNESGRRKMLGCVQKLCDSRGLYGCEAR